MHTSYVPVSQVPRDSFGVIDIEWVATKLCSVLMMNYIMHKETIHWTKRLDTYLDDALLDGGIDASELTLLLGLVVFATRDSASERRHWQTRERETSRGS